MNAFRLPGPADTEALGRKLGRALAVIDDGAVIALEGELGAGKTALARAVIRTLGYAGPVVSPTYTLMEPYAVAGRQLYHLDLYRLGTPEELDFLGVRELSGGRDWLLVEWPARGAGYLPPADITVALSHDGDGRMADITAGSERGRVLVSAVSGPGEKSEDSANI